MFSVSKKKSLAEKIEKAVFASFIAFFAVALCFLVFKHFAIVKFFASIHSKAGVETTAFHAGVEYGTGICLLIFFIVRLVVVLRRSSRQRNLD